MPPPWPLMAPCSLCIRSSEILIAHQSESSDDDIFSKLGRIFNDSSRDLRILIEKFIYKSIISRKA